MGESIKALCALALMVGSIAGSAAWFMDPGIVNGCFRFGGPLVACAALGTILLLHFRRDRAPDYLGQRAGNYFNRDGFCFALVATSKAGVCHLEAYFQNQFDQPCRGRIAIRPARGFWLGRVKMETIAFDVECEPAAYGVASMAIPLPPTLQGKRQSFEIGASVEYPQGKGLQLRFRDGIFLRSNSTFGNAFGTALMLAGAATGQVVLVTPATTKIVLPSGVAEEYEGELCADVRTLWKLGDPPIPERDWDGMR